jgi:hypothetical protein
MTANPINPATQTPLNQDPKVMMELQRIFNEQKLQEKNLNLQIPQEYASQDKDIWQGYFNLINYLYYLYFIDEETIPNIAQYFGKLDMQAKRQFLQETYDKARDFEERRQVMFTPLIQQSLLFDRIDEVLARLTPQAQYDIVLKFFGSPENIPPELAKKMERNLSGEIDLTYNFDPSKYKNNVGLRLSDSNNKQSYSNTGRGGVTNEDFSRLLDELSLAEVELSKNPIPEQKVTNIEDNKSNKNINSKEAEINSNSTQKPTTPNITSTLLNIKQARLTTPNNNSQPQQQLSPLPLQESKIATPRQSVIKNLQNSKRDNLNGANSTNKK